MGVILTAAVLTMGPGTPSGAEEDPLPDPCRLHPAQVVNPGCIPVLSDRVEETANAVAGPVLDPPETYPDLVPNVTQVFVARPFTGFDPATNRPVYGSMHLWFDTWSQNLGTVALDVLSDEPANIEDPTVSQCVAWTGDVCRERRTVGGFEVHTAHKHVHFKEFAQYELRRVLSDGSVDYSAGGLLDSSEKVSFCLIDSTRVRNDARPVRTYVGCTTLREGISAGWADIYAADLAGQQLHIDGLSDGRYALVVSMDYADRIWESDNGNNVAEVIVELSNGGTRAAIVERRWP